MSGIFIYLQQSRPTEVPPTTLLLTIDLIHSSPNAVCVMVWGKRNNLGGGRTASVFVVVCQIRHVIPGSPLLNDITSSPWLPWLRGRGRGFFGFFAQVTPSIRHEPRDNNSDSSEERQLFFFLAFWLFGFISFHFYFILWAGFPPPTGLLETAGPSFRSWPSR